MIESQVNQRISEGHIDLEEVKPLESYSDQIHEVDLSHSESIPKPVLNQDDDSSYALYDVHLDFFSGPMDLLLHLVSLKEVPIAEVSMSDVLDQYLEVVTSQAEDLDLEKASEYLVIAATLMVLKSKALLPAEPVSEESDDSGDEYSRFFEDLRERLRAFELTKSRAQALIEIPQLGVDTFIRSDKSAIEIPPEMIAEGDTSSRLGSLFLSLVKRVGGLRKSMLITVEPVSIVSSMMKLVDALKKVSARGQQSFISLIGASYSKKDIVEPQAARNVVLGGFIAVLELAKRGMIQIHQDFQKGEISLSLRMKEVGSSDEDFRAEDFQSEFDEPKDEQNLVSEIQVESSNVLDMEEYRSKVSSKLSAEPLIQEEKISNQESEFVEFRNDEVGNG